MKRSEPRESNAPDYARYPADIDRRTLLKGSVIGGSALLTGVIRVAPAIAAQSLQMQANKPLRDLPDVSAETVERVARDFFGFEILEADADAVARIADSTLKQWHSIGQMRLPPIDPPYDFTLIRAEAERLSKQRAGVGD